MNRQRTIAKWGFGMAPISPRMRQRYDAAVQTVCDLLYGNPVDDDVAAEALSELKGMFNRYIRKDQWDYAMVGAELGNPPARHARHIVNNLLHLRRSLMTKDDESMEAAMHRLEDNNIFQYLENYQNRGYLDDADGAGWVYVLSTRESPNILKIGRTERSVSQRVKEINSATGLLFPFGARYVFRVGDSVAAENAVHIALSNYRVRDDREFFEIDPNEAERMIRECLREHQLRYRTKGTIAWFDLSKFYGFIKVEKHDDVFVHGSEMHKDDIEMVTLGAKVAFFLNRNRRGSYATQVTIIR